jgi:hypothetical protein
MAPGDLQRADLQAEKVANIGGHTCHRGIHLGFADGEVWLVSDETPQPILAELALVHLDNTRREQLLEPYVLVKRFTDVE